jgi:ElaB/YqjD/DUF883 family membrane-anchored ribosome-binding protein
MNAEELVEPNIGAEQTDFDAHEFDGLREDFERRAENFLEKADEFVRQNPWLCLAVAASAGCAVAYWLRRRE